MVEGETSRSPRVVCAKRDVKCAFKWHRIKPEDAAEFGSQLPGSEIGLDSTVLCIYLPSVFGWVGAPGEYLILVGQPNGGMQQGDRAFLAQAMLSDMLQIGSWMTVW